MKTLAIVQARMGSTRLPGKVMKPVLGTPLIELLLERLSCSATVEQIVLATTVQDQDQVLAEHVSQLGYMVYRGSETDVLDRFYRAAEHYKAGAIVRVTADCPLIDPQLVDQVVGVFHDSGADYASNIHPPTYPDGLDVEVFRRDALEQAWQDAATSHQREHVTPYLYESGKFRLTNVSHATDYSGERWTLDEPADLAVITRVFEHFQPRRDFGWQEIVEIRQQHPDWFTDNAHLQRNQALHSE